MIHLHTLVGERVTTLRWMLEHYRNLGIQSFLVHVHLTDPHDVLLDEVRAVTSDFGVPITSVVIGNWQEFIVRTYAQSRSRYPNDWHILADQDEFHTFPLDLSDLIQRCEKSRYDYVSGCWVDRIAASGDLPEIDSARSIWEQFPIGAFYSYPIGAADPRKVVLARSSVNLVKGQHFALNGKGCPITEAFVQVHHFKWVAGIVPTLEARASFLKAGGYSQHVESSRFLKHIKDHGGRLNLEDPRILIAECSRDYAYWPLVLQWLILLSNYSDIGQQIIPGPLGLLTNADGIVRRVNNLSENIQAGQNGQLCDSDGQETRFLGFERLRQIWINSRY